jgi:hypothetical protein
MLFLSNKQNMVGFFLYLMMESDPVVENLCPKQNTILENIHYVCQFNDATSSQILRRIWIIVTDSALYEMGPVDGMRWIRRHMELCYLKISRARSHEVRWWWWLGRGRGQARHLLNKYGLLKKVKNWIKEWNTPRISNTHWKHVKNKKFLEELIVYFPLIWHGPHRKRRVQQFFYSCMYPLSRECVNRAVA